MITVSELIGRDGYVETLRDLSIWNMDVDDVMPAHLQGFFYRSKIRTDRETARHTANSIAQQISAANAQKIVRNNRLNDFSISEPPFLSGELRKALREMEMVKRRCVFFALITGLDLEDAVALTWQGVKIMREGGMMVENDVALDVLNALPRHFKSPLVFWTTNSQYQPVSLIGLRAEVEMAFCMTYEELRDKVQTMLFIDSALDARELTEIWRSKNG